MKGKFTLEVVSASYLHVLQRRFDKTSKAFSGDKISIEGIGLLHLNDCFHLFQTWSSLCFVVLLLKFLNFSSFFLYSQIWQEGGYDFAFLIFCQFKTVRLGLEKWKGWQALLGLSGLAVLLGSSSTSLTNNSRRVSGTPKSKSNSFRNLMVLLIGVSVNESLCTKKNFLNKSFFRRKNAAQNKLAFISQIQAVFSTSTYFLFPNE